MLERCNVERDKSGNESFLLVSIVEYASGYTVISSQSKSTLEDTRVLLLVAIFDMQGLVNCSGAECISFNTV